MTAYDRLWFFMDEFGNKSFEKYARNMDGYVRSHFDSTGFSNNNFSENPSTIGRLGNLLKVAAATTVGKKYWPLPKIIVVVPDDDIIKCFTDTDASGLTKAMSRMINYIMTEFERGVISFKESLPAKCKKESYPYFLWIQSPFHDGFSNNTERFKFNKALEDITKSHSNVSALELKKIWDPRNSALVKDNRFTAEGFKQYWEAVDRTIRYCDSIILKKKTYRKGVHHSQSEPKFTVKLSQKDMGQNDRFRWKNPRIGADVDRFQALRRLPSPPVKRVATRH